MPEGQERLVRALTVGSLMLAAIGISLFLFPADCDGAFASLDGVLYGMAAERADAAGLRGSHPLFHLATFAITALLRHAGIPLPGHVAIRIVSAIGAALLVFLVSRAAGGRRWAVGAGFAAAMLATRGFIIDAAVGETILPACAAALWVIDLATRPPFRPWRVWTALVIALLLRQDNVLIVPGVAAALWFSLPRGEKLAKIAKGLIVSALVTALAYAGFWWVATRGQSPLATWLVPPGLLDFWTASVDSHRLPLHVDSLSAAVVGRSWPRDDPNLWIGPAFILGLLAAAFLLRGRARVAPVVLAIVSTIVIRAAFFTWFDVANPEWSVLTLCLTAFLGARLAEGEPRWPSPVRVAGSIVLLILVATPLAKHGPWMLRLRERNLIESVRQAADAGSGCRFISYGMGAHFALEFLGIDHVPIYEHPDPRLSMADAGREFHAHPVPTMMVVDRWKLSTDPHATTSWLATHLFLDDLVPTPQMRVFRWRGRVFAVRYDPA